MSGRPLLLSASRQPLLAKCIGAAVLPVVGSLSDAADEGSAMHESLSMRPGPGGYDASLAAWPEIAERWGLDERLTGILGARLRSFTWCPPPGAIVETSGCLLRDGRVVLTSGGRGHYESLPDDAILPGQVDVVWSEPEPLWRRGDVFHCPWGSTLVVADYKTGDSAHVTSADRNEQLLSLGLMWARLSGAEAVKVAAVFPTRGEGTWDVSGVLGLAALDRIENRIRRRADRVETDREAFEQVGRVPDLVEGPHCTYCPAGATCPAKTAQLRAIVDEGDAAFVAGALSPEAAQKAAIMLPMVNALGRRMKEALQAYVRRFGPIDLANGNEWGPVPEQEDEIDFAKALPTLTEELGVERALGTASVSKKSIESAIGAQHFEQGVVRQRSAAMRRVLARLHDVGAISQVSSETWKSHRRRSELDEDASGEDVEVQRG